MVWVLGGPSAHIGSGLACGPHQAGSRGPGRPGVALTPRTKETARKQGLGAEAGWPGPRSPPAGARLTFLQLCCLRCARNAAHNSSLGGADSCGAAAAVSGGRLPQRPARGAQGGPGPGGNNGQPRARGGRGWAADSEAWGAGAKLGTKGPFSRAAGGCLHRCGGGCAAMPRAGRGGLAAHSSRSGRGGGGRAPRPGPAHRLSHGPSPTCSRPPANPPGSKQPVTGRVPSPHRGPAGSLRGLSLPPTHTRSRACHPRAQACTGREQGVGAEAFPSPRAGLVRPWLPGHFRKHRDSAGIQSPPCRPGLTGGDPETVRARGGPQPRAAAPPHRQAGLGLPSGGGSGAAEGGRPGPHLARAPALSSPWPKARRSATPPSARGAPTRNGASAPLLSPAPLLQARS